MKPWRENFISQKGSALRFQVTISTTEEMEALKMLITRLQESSFNPNRPPNISHALKELGSYVEFDNAIDQEEKMLARQIGDAGYGVEERNESFRAFARSLPPSKTSISNKRPPKRIGGRGA